MNKRERFYLKVVFAVVITFIISTAYLKNPYSGIDIGDTQNNLISASGILAGILIAFLSTKLLQFADNRIKAKLLLNEYADKLTQFRKLLFLLMKSQNFWILKKDVDKFKLEAPDATFHTIHGEGEGSKELRQKFWLSEPENPVDHSTVDLYLSMEEIAAHKIEDSYWVYDNSLFFDYDLDYLARIQLPSHQIWYYLDCRYAKHGKGRFEDSKFSPFELDDFNILVASIDPKFKARKFNRILIAEIGAYFYEDILPEMIRLNDKSNQRLTKSISLLFLSLTSVLVGGVMFPLLMKILELEYEGLFTAICVLVFIVSLFFFLIDLVGVVLDDDKPFLAKERIKIE